MPGWRARSDTPEWVSTLVICAGVSLCTCRQQAVHAAHRGRETHQGEKDTGINCSEQIASSNSGVTTANQRNVFDPVLDTSKW